VHLFRNPAEAAFYAADFHAGRRVLVDPSLRQCADIVGGVDVQAVWWAIHREAHRFDIINGTMPLVPPHLAKKTTLAPTNGTTMPAMNGMTLSALNGTAEAFDQLVSIAKAVGDENVWAWAGTAAGL
jgi:hypothetical protein